MLTESQRDSAKEVRDIMIDVIKTRGQSDIRNRDRLAYALLKQNKILLDDDIESQDKKIFQQQEKDASDYYEDDVNAVFDIIKKHIKRK